MIHSQINSRLMKKFIEHVLKELEGKWLIMGGTVLPLMDIDLRPTVDIDLVNLDSQASNQSTLQLMHIAEKLKLPIETINQAGSYFLSKIENVDQHLVLFKRSKKCEIYRPDPYLFLKLKISRLSESDLEDCIAYIKKNRQEARLQEKMIFELFQKSKHPQADSIEKAGRLNKLKNELRRILD